VASGRFQESVGGLRAAVKAFKALPDASQRLLNRATDETSRAVLLKARSRVPVRRGKGFLGYNGGALRAALDASMSQKTGIGLVGLTRATRWVGTVGKKRNAGSTIYLAGKTGSAAGGRVIVPSKYGHLVEFGHGGPKAAPAHPFMIPSAESERANYLDRCRQMGRELEQQFDISAGGLGRQETL
jgi:hypothetical protein